MNAPSEVVSSGFGGYLASVSSSVGNAMNGVKERASNCPKNVIITLGYLLSTGIADRIAYYVDKNKYFEEITNYKIVDRYTNDKGKYVIKLICRDLLTFGSILGAGLFITLKAAQTPIHKLYFLAAVIGTCAARTAF